MAKKKNSYQRRAAKKATLGNIHRPLDTHHDIKNTALETGKDLIIGVIGGGLAAAVIGRPSFVTGLAVTSIGHYFNNRIVATFGLGMMAANSFTSSKTVSGIDDGMNGVKDRLQAFKNSLQDKTYLSKIVKGPDVTVNGIGMGNLQYFDYANYSPQINGDFDAVNGDMGALDDIERQIENAGLARLQGAPFGAIQMDMDGVDGTDDGFGDVADLNY